MPHDTASPDIILPPPPTPGAAAPEPDWSTRPWGRLTILEARLDNCPDLLASVEFTAAGILRVRGVRVYRNRDGTGYHVSMPKRFGMDGVRQDLFYFPDHALRQQFFADIAWAMEQRARRNGGQR